MKKLLIAVAFIFSSHFIFAQNVGIGTMLPSEKLEVLGNIKSDSIKVSVARISENAGVGKILTSDAVGNASWQVNAAALNGSAGFGAWGSCATAANISEYNPVATTDALLGDLFGTSVALQGDYAVVGSPGDNFITATGQGTATIYRKNNSGVWNIAGKLVNTTPAANDNFGQSVAMSGEYVIVGAPLEDDAAGADQGSASIYKRNLAGSYILQQKIFNTSPAVNDNFGISVSINGEYALIGANGDNLGAGVMQGTASIYRRNSTTGVWEFLQQLANSSPAANDNFGRAVSINGEYAIVGAFGDADVAGASQGSASVYKINLSGTFDLQQKLLNTGAAANDLFGYSVSIFGENLIVGAYGDADIAGSFQGSASVYYLDPFGTWTFQVKLLNTSASANDQFGKSVVINGDYAVVGADFDDETAGSNQGTSTIYKRLGNSWQKYQHLIDPAATTSDQFGSSVALDANTKYFLIGAPLFSNFKGKAVFGKIN